MKCNKIDKIKAGTYEGYIWWSNKNEPDFFDGLKSTEEILLETNKNPFIIEAMLYDTENGFSYSIKYVDGEYIALKYEELIDEYVGESVPSTYYANRMPVGVKLNFRRYWNEEKDDLCEGMTVLRPGQLVFTGFQKEKQI